MPHDCYATCSIFEREGGERGREGGREGKEGGNVPKSENYWKEEPLLFWVFLQIVPCNGVRKMFSQTIIGLWITKQTKLKTSMKQLHNSMTDSIGESCKQRNYSMIGDDPQVLFILGYFGDGCTHAG